MLPVLLFSCKTAEPFTGDGIEYFPSTGRNEQRDSISFSAGTSISVDSLRTLWATPANHPNDFTITYDSTMPKQDTIPVIMLVCDTLKRSNGVLWLDSTGRVMDELLSTTPDVWWKPGFEIWEIEYGQVPCANPTLAMVCYGSYKSKFIGYLDRRKKPLESWIVVWMVKEIR